MKILHLITDLNTGGAETSLYRLLSGMDRSRFDSQVVSLLPPGSLGGRIAGLGIRVRSLGMQPGRASPSALVRLASWLREEPPDLLQTWLYHADLLGLLAAGAAGVPLVVWNIRNSELDLSQYRRLSGLVVRACARLSAYPRAVISNSRAGKESHVRFGYHPPRWVVIPNGIDPELFKPDPQARLRLRRELGLPAETILIGQVARYDPMKNQAGFLAAAGEWTRGGGGAHFVMAGQGVTRDNLALVGIAERQGILDRVHLLGRQDEMPRFAAGLDLLTSASTFGEGFPNVVAEAMACGVPCVVTDVGDSALLVGETGLVVPPGDPAALARGWTRLISAGPQARGELGASARRRIIEEFGLERTVSAYTELYLALGKSRSGEAGGKAV